MLLSKASVFFLDCQTTATSPRQGRMIEVGWAIGRMGDENPPEIRTSLVRLPEGATIPKRVQRMTGIQTEDLIDAPSEGEVWSAVLADFSRCQIPKAISYYARFENAFFSDCHGRISGGPLPFEFCCAFEVARRLFPNLPSLGIRAVSGFLGRVIPAEHRARAHVKATLWIWQCLVEELANRGVHTEREFNDWLQNTQARRGERNHTRIARESRLSLPKTPGVYRMLSSDGTLLYVGKAKSLHSRVNSYFRVRGRSPRVAEMLSQVSEIQVTPTESALEAALWESDEIKTQSPRYNISLQPRFREITFFSDDFGSSHSTPDKIHGQGPFVSRDRFDQIHRLNSVRLRKMAPEELFSGLSEGVFKEGWQECQADLGLSGARRDLPLEWIKAASQRLPFAPAVPSPEEEEPLVWNEGQEWTAKLLASTLEHLLFSAARQRRRARWIAEISESFLAWDLPTGKRRWIQFHRGKIDDSGYLSAGAHRGSENTLRLSRTDRLSSFDLFTYDRLRIALTEMRILLGEGNNVVLGLSSKFKVSADFLRRVWLRQEGVRLALPLPWE
jgi:DNA polymerase III subunit epsilon